MSSGGGSSGANYGFGVGLAGGASTAVAHQGQGVAALLVMLAVLCFMFAYCCWGAPFCRALCRRHCYCCCYCCCRLDELADSESGGFGSAVTSAATGPPDQPIMSTPTIILLPHGRTFVVHGRIFTEFQADNTGLDLVELGESVMRAQRGAAAAAAARHHHHHHHHLHHSRQLQDSQGSIIDMDADTPSKDSMGSLGCFPPPTYESIYGKDEEGDLPPSYSDILLHRFANLPFEIEMQDYGQHHRHDSKDEMAGGPRIISNPIAGNFAQGYPSRSLPRRNPSLISNPLDGYYNLDNELASLHASAQRRSSAAAEVRIVGRTGSACAVNLAGDDSRTNVDDPAGAENTLDNRFSGAREQASRSQNDLMNSRNLARSDDSTSSDLAVVSEFYARRRRRRRRRSEGSTSSALATAGIHRNRSAEPEAGATTPRRLESEPEDVGEESGETSADDEEQLRGNFQTLTDIRESRV